MPDTPTPAPALTDEQIGAYTGWLVYAAIPDGEALLEFNAWYAAVVARAKREALAEASTLSGDQAVEAARYVLDLLRGESGLPDPDTLALAIEYTAGVVAVHAKREERERIEARAKAIQCAPAGDFGDGWNAALRALIETSKPGATR